MSNRFSLVRYTIIVFAIWYLMSTQDRFIGVIPPPHHTLMLFANLEFLEELFLHSLKSIVFVVWSVSIGLVIGHIVGVIASLFKVFGMYNFGVAMKSIPVTLLIPAFFAVFGLKLSIPLLIAIPIFSLSLVNSFDATLKASRQREQIANFLSLNRYQYLKHIAIWESVEAFFISAKLGVMYSISLVIAFDYFIGVIGGIGMIAKEYGDQREMEEVFAILIVVAFLSSAIVNAIEKVGKKFVGWKYEI